MAKKVNSEEINSEEKTPEQLITSVDYIDTLAIHVSKRNILKMQYKGIKGVKTIAEWKTIIK